MHGSIRRVGAGLKPRPYNGQSIMSCNKTAGAILVDVDAHDLVE